MKRRTNPNWKERDKDKKFMEPKINKPRKRKKIFQAYLEIMKSQEGL